MTDKYTRLYKNVRDRQKQTKTGNIKFWLLTAEIYKKDEAFFCPWHTRNPLHFCRMTRVPHYYTPMQSHRHTHQCSREYVQKCLLCPTPSLMSPISSLCLLAPHFCVLPPHAAFTTLGNSKDLTKKKVSKTKQTTPPSDWMSKIFLSWNYI